MTHWLLPLPPQVSRSTGKSCCSVVVVSEGVKKAKKESISVGFCRVYEARGTEQSSVWKRRWDDLVGEFPLFLPNLYMLRRRVHEPVK